MKQELRQIREQLRKQISKQYEDKINRLENTIEFKNKMLKDCQRYIEMNNYLRKSNEELEEKIVAYEDWINRLQDFVNLPDEEREAAIKEYKVNKDINSKLDSLISCYGSIFSNLF